MKTVDIPGELISTGIHFYVFRPDIDGKDRWVPKRFSDYDHTSRTLNMPIFVASKYGLAGQATYKVTSRGLEWTPPERLET
jgi:hypothetical protein